MGMEFEFGETVQSNAFFDRNPKFFPAFIRLMAVGDKCFARKFTPTNRAEDICFDLGQTCRDDFVEIVFLAVNGYGVGAAKLLRGLYERAVALGYIVKHPEKAEKFVRFAAIQDYKGINAAREIASPQDFDKAIPPARVEEVRKLYEEIKPEFEVTRCRQCGQKGTAISWDMDVASMAREAGEPYQKQYLGSYVIPNLHVHATLASVQPKRPDGKEMKRINSRDGRVALLNAIGMFLLVLRSQSTLYGLALEGEIDACEQEAVDVWFPSAANR
jgi:hypothetical protein